MGLDMGPSPTPEAACTGVALNPTLLPHVALCKALAAPASQRLPEQGQFRDIWTPTSSMMDAVHLESELVCQQVGSVPSWRVLALGERVGLTVDPSSACIDLKRDALRGKSATPTISQLNAVQHHEAAEVNIHRPWS